MPQIVHLECNQKTFVDQMEFLCRNKILDAIWEFYVISYKIWSTY
jgi:hypothetical protein